MKHLKYAPIAVADFWAITPLHFRNAGAEGLLHFNFLMNMVVTNINNSTVKELNTVYALLLHIKVVHQTGATEQFHLALCWLKPWISTYMSFLSPSGMQSRPQHNTKVRQAVMTLHLC